MRLLKRVLEVAAARSGAARLRRSLRRHRAVILAYHNVLPHGVTPCGERSLHLPQRAFAEHLDVLMEVAEVVPLAAILHPSNTLDGRPRVAITWDDAYAGAVTAGVEEVTRRRLAATVFAVPGRLGGQTFWWDRLGEALGGQIPSDIRSRALHDLAGDEAAISRELSPSRHKLPESARSATESDLLAAARAPGITVGSHSWSHANLSRIDASRLEHELRASWLWLREHLPSAIPWLSYPYGLQDETVRGRIPAAGYQAACLVTGGWLPAGAPADPLCVPRLNVPAGLSRDGLLLRLSGFRAS